MILNAQQNWSVDRIKEYIIHDSLNSAEYALKTQIEQLKKQGEYDSIVHYLYDYGKVQFHLNEDSFSMDSTLQLAKEIEANSEKEITSHWLNAHIATLYHDWGQLTEAYAYAELSKEYALKINQSEPLINAEYQLAEYAMRLGNFGLFDSHIRSTVSQIESLTQEQPPISARAFNLMGALMYFSSIPDSASMYYAKALENIPLMKNTAENKYYLPATIKGNLLLLYQSQGKFSQAMELAKESINLNQEFLNQTKNHPITYKVLRNLSIGYRNLSSLYNDIGDLKKAEQISQIAMTHARKNFKSNSTEFFMGVIALVETNLALQNYDAVFRYLEEADNSLADSREENFESLSAIYNLYAKAYYGTDQIVRARDSYVKSIEYYEKHHPGVYSRDRLYALMNLAICYADLGEKEEAINTAELAYDKYNESGDESGYITNSILLTLARINLDLEDFDQSIHWSDLAIEEFEKQEKITKTPMDHIQYDFDRSEITMLRSKAKYFNSTDPNIGDLEEIYQDIEQAIKVLDERKSVINSVDGVNALIESNTEILDFAKKINLELFNKSKDNKYLDKLIGLHESVLYNKIRARLNIKESILFSGVPENIVARENELRQKINFDDYETEDYQESIQNFINRNDQWNSFLDTLRMNYPEYFKMRYSSIEQPLESILNSIEDQTTIVRYLFIDEKLFALILNKNSQKFIALEANDIESDIEKLQAFELNTKENCHLQFSIYESIWKPLEEEIKNERVIIIPDGPLFNLSFESLCSQKVDNYKDLIKNSLLKKHVISYNYSLFLTENSKEKNSYENDFIGFAPEFNETMKDAYSVWANESSNFDNSYTSLLPQPYAFSFAKKTSEDYKGKSYLNDDSTVANFKNNAGNHKIIYIGTHAEANNLNPELSRFIFAKNLSAEENSLFNYEIYNCDLSCELAILTACETGKPSYQPGEGMISLAHAFNYAGSKSILTSLWKIDEKTSIELIDIFQKNLAEGLTKDKALQLAKLEFLETCHEKLLAPQYWAGLVIMGDTNSIDIHPKKTPFLLFGSLGIGLMIIVIIAKKRKRKAA